jgi:hypothetical protein
MDLIEQTTSVPCSILNFGPGYGISRFAGPIPKSVEIRDVSAAGAARVHEADSTNVSLDDIAIVGMAVELPDAQDAAELWENLLNGVNSCSEVCFFSLKGLTSNTKKTNADIHLS